MATAEIISKDDNDDCCCLCSKNYNRVRPSLCQCKHCSKPLCLDCMNEHNNELLQNAAQVCHHYNELQQIVQTKQKMIVDETTESIKIVNEYFETYMSQLRRTQQKIITDIEKVKQDAQASVLEIDLYLRKLAIDIHELAKEGIVRTTQMSNLWIELHKVEQQLNTYQLTKTENLKMVIPEFSLQFQCLSDLATDVHQSIPIGEIKTVQPIENDPPPQTVAIKTLEPVAPLILPPKVIVDKLPVQSSVAKTPINILSPPRQMQIRSLFQDNVKMVSFPAVCNSGLRTKHRTSSYNIDRMASDGENIFYTSFFDGRPDLIIYCHLNDDNRPDRCRDWNQSRISDIIWWGSIKQFVCGTKDGIYTVDCTDGKFRITHVIRGCWADVIVAANTNNLFMWTNPIANNQNEIGVFSTSFNFIRKINFTFRSVGPYVGRTCGFCATDNLIALICTHVKENRKAFQVNFCDFNMNKFNTILLGPCGNYVEIRTDGKNRFFITTGLQQLHIVSPNGIKDTINLANFGNYIAVFNTHRIATSNGNANMEMIIYDY